MSNIPRMPPFMDLHSMPEEDRCHIIGNLVACHGKDIAFVVEDIPKADRYIRTIDAEFPDKITFFKYPFHGMIMVKALPKVQDEQGPTKDH